MLLLWLAGPNGLIPVLGSMTSCPEMRDTGRLNLLLGMRG